MSESLPSKTFCILPWMHLHALPDSSITPCCVWPYDLPIGDAKTQGLLEIWNSSQMRELRLQMLKGESSVGCTRCYRIEEAGLESRRLSMNAKFSHWLKRTRETKPDGSLAKLEVAFLDLRFSNLCNFRCRGCNAFLSSSWHQDEAALTGTPVTHGKLLSISREAPDFWQQLKALVPQVEEIYFAGGEPLLMAEHVEVLELLIKHGRTDVRLIYNTNLSHLYFKQVSFIDLWKKFNYVHLSLSLDDLAERAEYFRHGTQWQQITENLIRLRDEAPFIERGTYCTVSLFNVYYLPELINHLVDNDFIDPRFFEVNLLLDPPEYSVQVLPAWAKEKAAQKLKAHGLFWRSQGEPQKWGRIIYEIDSVMRYMQAADRAELLPRTQQMIQTLDRLRGESFATTYPELAAIME